MSKQGHLTAPIQSTKIPSGIPFIIANEAAERFSFYGMKAILVVFMTKYLMDNQGKPTPMSGDQAKEWLHWFTSAAYFFPFFGAILSDWLWGKYKTILILSMVYCIGHFALAVDATKLGLLIGLTLLSIGAGGIKPCVTAHVGDQFGQSNQHHMGKVYGWFYFSINFGAAISMFLIPIVLAKRGPHWAFGIPGVLMVLATLFFWMGRNRFVHIAPAGDKWVKEVFSKKGMGYTLKVIPIFVLLAPFWSLFDQTFSSWILQGEKMNLRWLGYDWQASQMTTANSVLILIYIPLFSYVVYPAIQKVFPLTPLRKISIGMFLAAVSFLVPVWIETQFSAGLKPSIGWQFVAYMILTAAEIMVSITCLEFSYTQAPKSMKSLILSLYLLSISLGNAFAAVVNKFIQNPDGSSKLEGAPYFLFFVAVMVVTSIVFVFVAKKYREETIVQDEIKNEVIA